jgi:transcription elongation GreA/GreB family factor
MTDRAKLKQALRDRMMSLEAAELEEARDHYRRYLADSKLDDREVHDRSDMAEARENADLAAAFDHPVHTHEAKVDAIENADFSVADAVRPGAVVGFEGKHFVVLVSTARFDVDGVTYMGISTQSPIYKAMDGLVEGDSFTFGGREITLDRVF